MAIIINSVDIPGILGLSIADDSCLISHLMYTKEGETQDDFFIQSAKAEDHSKLSLQSGDENKSLCQKPTGAAYRSGWDSTECQFWMALRFHLSFHPSYTIST